MFLHWLLGPQGEGTHGSWEIVGTGSAALQLVNGSPVKPSGHEHVGIWLMTSHRAFTPQVPGQGSLHLFLIQALSLWHSELKTHSGLQDSYGFPIYSGKHEQIPLSHWAFGPHGEGLHGSTGGGKVVIWIMVHWVNGSPVWLCKQVHTGICLMTWHSAFNPQEPGHGSLHLWFIQASWLLHSVLITHSGLQFGGASIKSGRHEQLGVPPIILHTALGPHGEG